MGLLALTCGFLAGYDYHKPAIEVQEYTIYVDHYIDRPVEVEVVKEVDVIKKIVIYPDQEKVEQSLGILEYARYSHQYYIDRPDKLSNSMGSLQHHIDCVNKYDFVIDFLNELKGVNCQ